MSYINETQSDVYTESGEFSAYREFKMHQKEVAFKILYLLNHVVMFKALYSVFFIYLFRMVAIWIQTNRLEKLQHL